MFKQAWWIMMNNESLRLPDIPPHLNLITGVFNPLRPRLSRFHGSWTIYIYMVYQHYRYRPVISSSPRKFPGCIADSARGFPSIILLWFSKSTNLTILGVSIRNSRHPLAALVSKTSRWPGGFGGSAQALQFLDQALQLGLPAVFTSKQRHVMILFV